MISEVFIVIIDSNYQLIHHIIDNYLIPKANELHTRNWNLHQEHDPNNTSELSENYFLINHVLWVNKIN